MKGLHPTIKSTVVTVFNFTLLGNQVQICPPEAFCGPFLSYVREDDDYYSICARLAAVAGDEVTEFEKNRIAVVSRTRVPTFISKPVVRSAASAALLTEQQQVVGGGGPNSAERKDDVSSSPAPPLAPSIWELLTKTFPKYADINHAENRMFNDYRIANQVLPSIGIQRSVSALGDR